MKIYTKTGDKGSTGLVSGRRVSKDDPRIDAYGTVDELNSCIGVVRSYLKTESEKNTLHLIQNKLFNLGSNLANEPGSAIKVPELSLADVSFLEQEIDRMSLALPALSNFILPAGSTALATAHLARTICRRAERLCVRLSHEQNIEEVLIIYLNRLSDFLFVLARYIGHLENVSEVNWDKTV